MHNDKISEKNTKRESESVNTGRNMSRNLKDKDRNTSKISANMNNSNTLNLSNHGAGSNNISVLKHDGEDDVIQGENKNENQAVDKSQNELAESKIQEDAVKEEAEIDIN